MQGKKPAKKTRSGGNSELSGRIDSISAGARFQFGLVSKKEGRCTYVIEAGEPARFAVMSGLVMSAYITGTKISVNGARNSDGLQIAIEIRIGAKPKQPKNPASRVKPSVAPAGEAPAAA